MKLPSWPLLAAIFLMGVCARKTDKFKVKVSKVNNTRHKEDRRYDTIYFTQKSKSGGKGKAGIAKDSLTRPSGRAFPLANLSIPQLFDEKKIHVYILSGDNSTRKQNCLSMMEQLQLQPRHYDFIHGPMGMTDEQVSLAIRTGALSPRWNMSRYRMGIKRYLCHLGKMKVLQAFLASGYEEMILYEDDVAVSTKYNATEAAEYMRLMLTIPSQEYDMQYLGYCFECFRYGYGKVELKPAIALRDGKQFHYTRVLMPLCNHAVLFRRKAAEAFIAMTKPFVMPSDVHLTHIICKTGQIVLRPAYPIFIQNRKAYGSFMGHTNEVPAFREKYSLTPSLSGRCHQDTGTCDTLYSPRYAEMYGFNRGEGSKRSGGVGEKNTARDSMRGAVAGAFGVPVPGEGDKALVQSTPGTKYNVSSRNDSSKRSIGSEKKAARLNMRGAVARAFGGPSAEKETSLQT